MRLAVGVPYRARTFTENQRASNEVGQFFCRCFSHVFEMSVPPASRGRPRVSPHRLFGNERSPPSTITVNPGGSGCGRSPKAAGRDRVLVVAPEQFCCRPRWRGIMPNEVSPPRRCRTARRRLDLVMSSDATALAIAGFHRPRRASCGRPSRAKHLV